MERYLVATNSQRSPLSMRLLVVGCTGLPWSILDQKRIALRQFKCQKSPRIFFWGGEVGGIGLAECSCLFFKNWQKALMTDSGFVTQKKPLDVVMEQMDAQTGILHSYHPCSVIELAENALSLCRKDVAIRLASSAVGWPRVFPNCFTIERSGILLAKLKAPFGIWAGWSAIFHEFLNLAILLDGVVSFSKDMADWANIQNKGTENVLIRTLEIAPPNTLEALRAFSIQLEEGGLQEVLKNRSWPLGNHEYEAESIDSWLADGNLNSRFVSSLYLEESERVFMKNAEWAIFNIPTNDYSMALAQWWRLIESLFRRIITDKIGELFDQNPSWLQSDLQDLTPRQKEKEAVFVSVLANPNRRSKITLSDIVLILEKCVLNPKNKGSCASVLRLNATGFFFKEYSGLFESMQKTVIGRDFLGHAPYFSRKNIDWFRNRSSHNEQISEIEANVGCIIARRIASIILSPFDRYEISIPILVDDFWLEPLLEEPLGFTPGKRYRWQPVQGIQDTCPQRAC